MSKKTLIIILCAFILFFIVSTNLKLHQSNTVSTKNIKKENTLKQSTKFLNKKFVTFGDSITWYDCQTFFPSHIETGQVAKGYQTYMREELGCTVDNQGTNGYSMPEMLPVIKDYNFANTDFVTLTSGANDHRLGVAVGTVQPKGSEFDTSTYAGAMQSAIEHILNANKDIKLYLLTPIQGWYNEYNTLNVPNTSSSAVGVLSEEYPNMMIKIAKLYGLPILDWYHKSRINQSNKTYLMGDNPAVFKAYVLHPTQKGYKKMADVLIPFLKNN